MPKVKLPITGDPYQNIDDVALSDKSVALYDAYVDESGATNRRFGHTLLKNLSNPWKGIDGLYWWDKLGKAIAVCGGNIYRIDDANGNFVNITGSTLNTGVKPTFAEHGSNLVIANGGRMVYTDGTANTAYIGDVDAPTAVTHVAFMDTYLLCNNVTSGAFHFSDVNNISSWSALSFANAEGIPDKINALNISWREIMLFGRQSVETWYNTGDGVAPFERREGAFIEKGCIAPYSVVSANNTWFWLDNTRRFVSLEGRVPKIISTPFDKIIQGFSTITDCKGDLFEIKGKPLIIWQFPTEGITFAYNYATGGWSQYYWWNAAFGEYQRFLGQSFCHCPDWGLYLVGSRLDSKIYKADFNTYTDDGDIIRTLRRTGWVNHGTENKKRSNRLDLRIKRGYGTGGTDPSLIIKWRNGGSSTWNNERYVNLKQTGNYEFETALTRLGSYRSRQWEFVLPDNTPLVLVEAEETIDVMGR